MPKWKLLSKAAFGFITGKVKGFVPDNEKQKEFVMKSMKTQDVYIQGGTWLFCLRERFCGSILMNSLKIMT